MSGYERSEAIVLRIVPWSETSLIVTLWTRDFGKISGVAKGARRPKSPFESALDLLAHSSVVFLEKAGDVLDVLTEAKLVRRFRSAQQSLHHLYSGYYVAELLLSMTEEASPISELFDLTRRTLEDLDDGSSPAEIVLRFEWHLLRLLGHMPSLENCVVCGKSGTDSSERVAFGIESGGVLCSNCLPGQNQVVWLRMATIDTLRGMLHNRWETTPLTSIEQPMRFELRSLMNRYFTALRHRPFELHRFLSDLGR